MPRGHEHGIARTPNPDDQRTDPVAASFRGLEETDRDFGDRWNQFVTRAVFAHLQQGYENAILSSRKGWKATFLWTERSGEMTSGALLLQKYLPGRLLSIGAIPCGPFWLPGHENCLPALFESLETHCRRTRAVFCRINIPCPNGGFSSLAPFLPKNLRQSGQIWSYWNPPRGVMKLDLAGGPAGVLKRMHPDMRNKSRRGQRRGLRIRRGGDDDIAAFVRLMRLMGERKKVLVREERHFRNLFEAYAADRVALFLAEADNACVAGILVATLGATAWELYAAFDWSKRRLYPNEALQMAVIDWLHSIGHSSYDLGGTCTSWPPRDSDKGYGVYVFKNRLGAEPVLLAPYCDLVYWSLPYPAAKMAENVAIPLMAEKGWGRFRVAYDRIKAEL